MLRIGLLTKGGDVKLIIGLMLLLIPLGWGQTALVRVGQNNTYTSGYQDFGSVTMGLARGATDPVTCTVGDIFFNTTTNLPKFCRVTDTWTIDVLGTVTNANALLCTSSAGVLKECNAASTIGGTLTLLGSGNVLTVQGGTATTLVGLPGSSQGTTPVMQIGYATSIGRLGQPLEIAHAGNYGGLSITSYTSSASQAPAFDWQRSKSATLGTQAAVASGDALGFFTFRGSNGSSFQDAAGIGGFVDGSVSGGSMPGRLVFSTTPSGTNIYVERLRIDNAGILTIPVAGVYGMGASGVSDTGLSRIGAGIIGVGTSAAGSYAGTIQLTKVIGGSAVGDDLILQSTSGVGSGDQILFKRGNNGATTALTLDVNGANFPTAVTVTGTTTLATSLTGNIRADSGVISQAVGTLPQSGAFSGVGTATTVFTVTIGTTMANTNYEVNVTPTSALSAALFYVTNKTTTAFDVTYLAGLTGTVTFDWAVFP